MAMKKKTRGLTYFDEFYISFTGAAVGAFPCFDGGQGTFTYQLSGE